MHCNALPLGLKMLLPPDFLRAGSACGLGIDLFGMRILSLAAWLGAAACSNTLAYGLSKIRAAREYDDVSFVVHNARVESKVFEDVDGSQHHGSL